MTFLIEVQNPSSAATLPIQRVPADTFKGVLFKKRRKKLQGFGKRYFVLDFSTSTLSYYLTSESSHLRGSIPLSLAAISANPRSNALWVDSGAELWSLRARNSQDWEAWKVAFERATRQGMMAFNDLALSGQDSNPWAEIESLVGRVAGLKEVVRNAASSVPPSTNEKTDSKSGMSLGRLTGDIDSIVSEFHTILLGQKQQEIVNLRSSLPAPASSRRASISDSLISDQEFFDADDNLDGTITILHSDESDEAADDMDELAITDDGSSEESDEGFISHTRVPSRALSSIRPRSSDLNPLPWTGDLVGRRIFVPPPVCSPPSLISFLRKNVGKDLATISMPVTANEPLGALQRYSETMEYSDLLDHAAKCSKDRGEQLMYVAAFAISSLANTRCEVRNTRKPFNPLLGETFELIREDKGFRFLAEKVSHRPPIFSCSAESPLWTLSHSACPDQKFWGRSVEINTRGTVRIHLIETNDSFSYSMPVNFLRNVIAGEKYVEPVGTMTVYDEVTNETALVTFKGSGGMFAGRGEDVTVELIDAEGERNDDAFGLGGKWTKSLCKSDGRGGQHEIWHAGNLVTDPAKSYGLPVFAAQLNEITSMELHHLPQTDSRFRPDVRIYEDGDFERAGVQKQRIEELQRERRKELESSGKEWQPRFFYNDETVQEEKVWRLKTGPSSYWSQRQSSWAEDLALW